MDDKDTKEGPPVPNKGGKISRRSFLRLAAMAAAGGLAEGCGAGEKIITLSPGERREYGGLGRSVAIENRLDSPLKVDAGMAFQTVQLLGRVAEYPSNKSTVIIGGSKMLAIENDAWEISVDPKLCRKNTLHLNTNLFWAITVAGLYDKRIHSENKSVSGDEMYQAAGIAMALTGVLWARSIYRNEGKNPNTIPDEYYQACIETVFQKVKIGRPSDGKVTLTLETAKIIRPTKEQINRIIGLAMANSVDAFPLQLMSDRESLA